MELFIVYYYYYGMITNPTKYIGGIYDSQSKAIERQKVLCGNDYKVNQILQTVAGNGVMTFINVIPSGDCNIEIFTKKPKNVVIK